LKTNFEDEKPKGNYESWPVMARICYDSIILWWLHWELVLMEKTNF